MNEDINSDLNIDPFPKLIADIGMEVGEGYQNIRTISDLDARATTLLLMSIALIALCLVENKPITVEVIGFSLQASHWLWLALPIGLMVIHLSIQLYSCWIAEYRNWQLVHLPKLIASLKRIDDLMASLKKRTTNFLEETINVTSVNAATVYFRNIEDMHLSTEEYRKRLVDHIDQEKNQLKWIGFFNTYSEEKWLAEKTCELSYELACHQIDAQMSDSDWDCPEANKKRDEQIAQARTASKACRNQVGQKTWVAPRFEREANLYTAYSRLLGKQAKNIGQVVMLTKLRILLLAVIPLALAGVSLILWGSSVFTVLSA